MRAKFYVNSVDEMEDSKVFHLGAVISGSPENESFAKATPSGSLSIKIDNGTEAVNFLEKGKEYYIDFTAAEAAATQSEG